MKVVDVPVDPNARQDRLLKILPMRTFYNNVQRLELDVATIAPIHGGRVYPWADFASIVNGAEAN